MPVVPFSRNPTDAVPEDLRPSDTHLMMAAAVMQEMGRLPSAHYPQPKPNLDYAKPKDDWETIIEHKGQLIDPSKLSPKDLKRTGIKY